MGRGGCVGWMDGWVRMGGVDVIGYGGNLGAEVIGKSVLLHSHQCCL